MKRVWLIYNPASGSVADAMIATIERSFADAAIEVAGRTVFPDESLPEVDALRGVDTVVVAAGDGTINAAALALEDWPGTLLVLPGGTMNMLPKILHGEAASDAILTAATGAPATTLATVEAGDNRALVAALIGPAASWVHAREAIRKGRWARVRRAAGLALHKSVSQSVRVMEGGRRSRGYRAISIAPDGDRLRVIKVSAQGWRDGVAIGWNWLRGDIGAARGVTIETLDRLELASARPVFALFDGEPAHLPAGTAMTAGRTRLSFVTTL